MVNYDMTWNPARLEQRMGRLHRYGQRHDPVVILNLVAGETREGSVLKTLLDKLELIRREVLRPVGGRRPSGPRGRHRRQAGLSDISQQRQCDEWRRARWIWSTVCALDGIPGAVSELDQFER